MTSRNLRRTAIAAPEPGDDSSSRRRRGKTQPEPVETLDLDDELDLDEENPAEEETEGEEDLGDLEDDQDETPVSTPTATKSTEERGAALFNRINDNFYQATGIEVELPENSYTGYMKEIIYAISELYRRFVAAQAPKPLTTQDNAAVKRAVLDFLGDPGSSQRQPTAQDKEKMRKAAENLEVILAMVRNFHPLLPQDTSEAVRYLLDYNQQSLNSYSLRNGSRSNGNGSSNSSNEFADIY